MNFLRRFGLVFVSCIILLLALLCPASAAGTITREDLIDFGYSEGESGELYVQGFDPLSFTSILLTSEPNYPDFSPNDIPWKDAPQYVKDILIMDYKDFTNSNFDFSTNEFKVPFVCVRLHNNTAMVYVGINVSVIYTTNNNRVFIGGVIPPENQTSYLYRATFNITDMTMTTPWYNASNDTTSWGDGQYVFAYTGALANTTDKYDLYFYGANNVFRSNKNYATIAYSYSDTSEHTAIISVNQPLGFQADTIFFSNQSSYTNTYCKFFTPTIYPELNSGVIDDYGDAESALVGGYDPGNISGDINIDIDTDSWSAIFQVFNMFVTGNSVVVTLIITMLSLGFLALLLNR